MNSSIVSRSVYGPLLLLALLTPSVAAAWGEQGHRLVAELAWDQLTPHAKAQIAPLLRDEQEPTLAGVASWADRLRGSDPGLGRRSAKWHYVNIGNDNCAFSQQLDCPKGNCVVDAISAQTLLLADISQPDAVRTQALKFVVHFIGDVHQPLHAGHAADKGGNTVQINFQGKGSNLHRLWDSGLLSTRGLDTARYLQHLRKLPAPATGSSRARTLRVANSARQWAEHSCKIVRQPGFYPRQAKLQDDYVQTWRPVAEAQLRLAGGHLAAVLNQALAAP